MSRCPLLRFRLLLLAMLSIISPAAASAQPEPTKPIRVILVENQTFEAACRRWVHNPRYTYACPPGAVIVSREASLEDVQRSGIQDYAMLTGDPARDEYLHATLIQRFIDKLHPAKHTPPTPLACAPHSTTTIGQSAILQGIRLYEEVSYSLQSTCAVTNIVDRARADVDGQIGWLWSKNTDSQMINRTQAISNLWTAWHSLPNSGKGQRHITRMQHYNTNELITFVDNYF